MLRRPYLAMIVMMALGACSGELTITGSGSGPDGGLDSEARRVWNEDILPLVSAARAKGACTACHQGAAPIGPPFLGATAQDNYRVLTSGLLIGPTPAASRFLTIGEHTGNGFCTGVGAPAVGCTTDEATVVSNWIVMVNAE